MSVDSQNVDGKPVPRGSLLFCHPSKHIIASASGARISRSRTAWHHNDDGSFIDTWVGLESTASSRWNAIQMSALAALHSLLPCKKACHPATYEPRLQAVLIPCFSRRTALNERSHICYVHWACDKNEHTLSPDIFAVANSLRKTM